MLINEKPLISVIVPVYNVQEYLDKCVYTIRNQTYKNLEIILIDDGSTDMSGKKCDEYQKNDSRIKVVHKKNAGLGYARNSGLDIATGKYVLFVDSDDFLELEMIEKLYYQLVKTNSDTSYCGYYKYYDDEYIEKVSSGYNEKIFCNREIIENVLLEMISGKPEQKKEALLSMSVWHALYSNEIINESKLRFVSEREYISEDIIFHIEYLQKAKKVCYIDTPLYFYRCNNSGSLTHRYDPNEFNRHKVQVEKINKELSKILNESEYCERTQRYLLGRLRTCIQKSITYKKHNKDFKLIKQIKNIINDEEVRRVIKQYPYNKNSMQLRIFNFFVDYKLYYGIIILIKTKALTRRERF